MAKRRDKYGRYRGKGGIKPYKSNLAGVKKQQSGKKMSGRKKAVLAVAATATVVAVGATAYKNRRGIARVTGTETKVAGKLMDQARAKKGPRATPLLVLKSPNKSGPVAGGNTKTSSTSSVPKKVSTSTSKKRTTKKKVAVNPFVGAISKAAGESKGTPFKRASK